MTEDEKEKSIEKTLFQIQKMEEAELKQLYDYLGLYYPENQGSASHD